MCPERVEEGWPLGRRQLAHAADIQFGEDPSRHPEYIDVRPDALDIYAHVLTARDGDDGQAVGVRDVEAEVAVRELGLPWEAYWKATSWAPMPR